MKALTSVRAFLFTLCINKQNCVSKDTEYIVLFYICDTIHNSFEN